MIDADAFNAFEAKIWETKAAGYDSFFGDITSRLIEPLLDAMLLCSSMADLVAVHSGGGGYAGYMAYEATGSFVVAVLAGTLSVVGEKWSLLVLREAFLGVRRFAETAPNTQLYPAFDEALRSATHR